MGKTVATPALAAPAVAGQGGNGLRAVLGSFATGVTVVSVAGPVPHGMTANSFTSVSLDPPLVLLCVDRDAVMHGSILAADAFAVSVLGEGQADVARHFADPRRPRGITQFDPVAWAPGAHTGAPLLSDAIAWLECRLWRAYDGGDHSIFVGRLVSARRRDAGAALVFFGGRFWDLPAATNGGPAVAGPP